MKVLNTLLNVLVVTFTVFVVFLIAGIADEKAIFEIETEAQVLWLYKIMAAIGGGLLLLKVMVSSLYIANLKYETFRAQLKINDLKADLYEKRQEFRSNSYKQQQVPELKMA